MDILIIGGTAYFGRDLVELALEADHRVTIFSRGNKKPTFWNNIKHIAGDRRNPADVKARLKGLRFDVVVDNIAYNATDVRNTLEALEGNVGRYVLTSTSGVYIGMGCFDMPFSEDMKIEIKHPRFSGHPTPANDEFINYVTGKLEAEKVLVEQDEVAYTIVRPSSIAGPNDPSGRSQFYFRRLLDGNPLILTNGGNHIHNLAYRRDVARGCFAAMNSKEAVNQIYNFAQYEMFRVLDWVRLAADLLEVEADIVSISSELLQQSGFVYSEPWSFTGNIILDVSRAQIDLGYQSTRVETWMAVTTEWYREKDEWKNSLEGRERQEEIVFIQKYRQLMAQL
jgi:nucleoside-diphosphate-sugar epimerase